ncbi:MAG: ferrous iron transport protein A [Actinobacteria bacterium]|nr:ferrous iron transport protein A [Actinomycetota bacterium]MBU1494287.1 ferrous iron transport protein A [Actinomycetota bacterium]
MTTIATVPPHRTVRVMRVAGGRRLVQRLAALGVVPGASIRVDRASDPALIAVGHTRVAIGRQAARAVEVEEER